MCLCIYVTILETMQITVEQLKQCKVLTYLFFVCNICVQNILPHQHYDVDECVAAKCDATINHTFSASECLRCVLCTLAVVQLFMYLI